jgi:hypothetical protein
VADTGKTAEARQKQSDASKSATLDLLKNKKRAKETFTLFLLDEDGEKVEVEMTFQSIGAREYDKLVSKHPPKAEQRVDGATFDMDSFAPALIARCSVDPEISDKDAKEIWESPDWSRGDLMVLFSRAVQLNNRGIDIPFNENG